MKLTNDTYKIILKSKNATEAYYKENGSWIKESSKGNKFNATSEQVLNHILPVLAGLKSALEISVEHKISKQWQCIHPVAVDVRVPFGSGRSFW